MIDQRSAVPGYASALAEAGHSLRRLVGVPLWDVLHKATKSYLRRGELQYRSELMLAEEDQNFADSMLNFSNALLNELIYRFWRGVRSAPRSYSEAHQFLQRSGDPEWGQWVRLFSELGQGRWPSIVQVALADRIDVPALVQMSPEFEELRLKGRNKAAHRRCIDREAAAILYDRLVRRGLLRRTFRALHGV